MLRTVTACFTAALLAHAAPDFAKDTEAVGADRAWDNRCTHIMQLQDSRGLWEKIMVPMDAKRNAKWVWQAARPDGGRRVAEYLSYYLYSNGQKIWQVGSQSPSTDTYDYGAKNVVQNHWFNEYWQCFTGVTSVNDARTFAATGRLYGLHKHPRTEKVVKCRPPQNGDGLVTWSKVVGGGERKEITDGGAAWFQAACAAKAFEMYPNAVGVEHFNENINARGADVVKRCHAILPGTTAVSVDTTNIPAGTVGCIYDATKFEEVATTVAPTTIAAATMAPAPTVSPAPTVAPATLAPAPTVAPATVAPATVAPAPTAAPATTAGCCKPKKCWRVNKLTGQKIAEVPVPAA